MVFVFPVQTSAIVFLHFQGDEILPGQQSYSGVYFPFLPHEDALIAMETIVVPHQELDIMGVDPLVVMTWEESAWYCRHWDVPRISEWNECVDFMWRSTWHKKNNTYLEFIKKCAEDPLIERIVELETYLEEVDEAILSLLPGEGSSSRSTPALFRRSVMASSGSGGPPLSELSDIFRDATMGKEAKMEVARPSPKHARSLNNPQGSIARMGNPMNSNSRDPQTKCA